MGIALTLQEYLDDHHVPYDVMMHKRTNCAFDTARATHVPGERLAKAVVLTREGGFVIAVVPATARVRLDVIERMLHCHVQLANEDEISELFPDCELGAVPPIPEAYAVDAFVDEGLINHSTRTVVIDRRGVVAASIEGNQHTAAQLGDLVSSVLASAPSRSR